MGRAGPCFLTLVGCERLGQEGTRHRPVLWLPRRPAGSRSAGPCVLPSLEVVQERLRGVPGEPQVTPCLSSQLAQLLRGGGTAPGRAEVLTELLEALRGFLAPRSPGPGPP